MALGNNSSSALTHTLTSKKPAQTVPTIIEPLLAVTDTTPKERVGTVVNTAHGVAVQVGEELIPVEDSVASILTPGQNVEVDEQTLSAGQGFSVVDIFQSPGLGGQKDTQQQDSTTVPRDVVPALLVGVIAALLPALRRREGTYRVGARSGMSQYVYAVQRAAMPQPMSLGEGAGPSLPRNTALQTSPQSKLDNQTDTVPISKDVAVPNPDIGPLGNEYGNKAGNGWVASAEPAHHPMPGGHSEGPGKEEGPEKSGRKKPNSVYQNASTVGAWVADLTATDGELTDALWDHYRGNTGQPVSLTTGLTDQILGQADHNPAGVSKSPLAARDDHHQEFLKHLKSPGGPYEIAKNTGEAQTGTFRTTWVKVSTLNPGIYMAIGTFSVAYSTSYVVYPDGTVKIKRIGYVYDWYNFGKGDGPGGNALAMEEAQEARPFRVTGKGSVITDEFTL